MRDSARTRRRRLEAGARALAADSCARLRAPGSAAERGEWAGARPGPDPAAERAAVRFSIATARDRDLADRLAQRGIPFVFYTGQLEPAPQHEGWPQYKVISKPAPRETIVAAVVDMLEG